MPKFIIPVTFTMYGKHEIEAGTIKEALAEILNNEEVMPLPAESEYILNSLNVNMEDVLENNVLTDEEETLVIDYLDEVARMRQENYF